MKKYDNFISLGYFCSVALELERFGLRRTSSPFDWCISDLEGIILAIDSNFEDFLKYTNLSQNKDSHGVYRDDKYNISFFHDFDKYLPLQKQISKVQEKYNRRIIRFYEIVTKPTLFVRYISDEQLNSQGKSIELDYIENNYDEIIGLFKSFNSDNDIIFIANSSVSSEKIRIYSVEPDENDVVARKPVDKNESLFSLFNQLECVGKDSNILRYEKKEKNRKNIINLNCKKIQSRLKEVLLKEYIHSKQYWVDSTVKRLYIFQFVELKWKLFYTI